MKTKKYNNLTVRKRFGQNFLVDENKLNEIVEKSNFNKSDFVLEIGPGHGALTEKILPKVSKLTAVEIDRDLVNKLNQKFSHFENLEIISEDVLNYDLNSLDYKDYKFENRKVIGNIPYYITTPIIMKFIEEKQLKEKGISNSDRVFSEIILMMQKEVGERLLAEPGTKEYGALSVISQYACNISHLLDVNKNCFYPKPKVDSVIISLKPKVNDEYKIDNPSIFWRLVKSVFTSRRKTLRNSLKIGNFTEEQIEKVSNNFDISIRGETMNLETFSKLSNIISS